MGLTGGVDASGWIVRVIGSSEAAFGHADPLEELGRIIDFEAFHPVLVAALAYGDGAKGSRPPYDPVAMLKVLVLAAQNNVADARIDYLIRDRLNWQRFLGFDLGAPTPDANTIGPFREKLTGAGALDAVFTDFDRQLKERGYLAMGGQFVEATLVAAPKQRNTAAQKDAIKAGKSACEIWPDEPARAAQKDTDARWMLKFAKPVLSLSKGPGCWRTARRASTSPSQASATRAACRSAGPSASSANARSPTVRASTGGCCAISSPATTLLPTSGRTPPAAARPTRHDSSDRAGTAAFTEPEFTTMLRLLRIFAIE